MATPTGAQIIARSLRDLGVAVLFGIVGIPVVEIAEEAINLGIRFIGFRNEQAASYAASAYGYLTGRPGVCLVVGGPGVLHAMAGVCQYLIKHNMCFTVILTHSPGAFCAHFKRFMLTLECDFIDWQFFCQCLPPPSPRRFLRNTPRNQRRIPGT